MATRSTSHIPPGLGPIIPQLVIKGAQKALDFYRDALGAEVLHSMPGPGGSIMHAAVRVGDGTIFVSDASEFAKPTAANLFVYVKDVDAVYNRAVKAGATVAAPLADMFWGDRWGMIADPFGNLWQLATNKEVVSPDEMQQRMAANLPK
jgi:PhnB protein